MMKKGRAIPGVLWTKQVERTGYGRDENGSSWEAF
jgi:hypothetical protein